MIGATEAVELVFRETSRPTLVKGPWNADLLAQGRFWVNALRAGVVRSEVEFDFGAEAEARVTTDYRPEPVFAMWVPAEMREHFADIPHAKVQTFPAPFNGVARYERFRRFTVSTEEEFALPPPSGGVGSSGRIRTENQPLRQLSSAHAILTEPNLACSRFGPTWPSSQPEEGQFRDSPQARAISRTLRTSRSVASRTADAGTETTAIV